MSVGGKLNMIDYLVLRHDVHLALVLALHIGDLVLVLVVQAAPKRMHCDAILHELLHKRTTVRGATVRDECRRHCCAGFLDLFE
jgi:hypothetical protein